MVHLLSLSLSLHQSRGPQVPKRLYAVVVTLFSVMPSIQVITVTGLLD
jgi:hypothetical protein